MAKVKKNLTLAEIQDMLAKAQAGQPVTLEVEAPSAYRSAKLDPIEATAKVRAEHWQSKLRAYVKNIRFSLEGNFKDEAGNLVKGQGRGGVQLPVAQSVADEFGKIRSRLSRFGHKCDRSTNETAGASLDSVKFALDCLVQAFETHANAQKRRAEKALATLNAYIGGGCKEPIGLMLDSLGFSWGELNGTVEDMEADGQTDKERIAEAAESS